MNKCCRTILVILTVVLIHSVCFSQNSTEKKGFVSTGSFKLKVSGRLKPFSASDKKSYFNGNIQGKWKLWPLLNEPVEYSVAAWELRSISIINEDGKIKTYHPCRKGEACRNKNMIPWKIMKQVQIYDLAIRFRVKSENRKTIAAYIADPGVMAAPGLTGTKISGDTIKGKNSFNVPGSPSWNKLFIYHNPDGGFIPRDRFYRDEKDGEFYAHEAYAKKLIKKGVNLIIPEIEDMKIDATSVELWLSKRERENREKQLLKQHEKQKTELNRKKRKEKLKTDFISSGEPARNSTNPSKVSDFEQELLSKKAPENSSKTKRNTDNFSEDIFADQLENQLFEVELNRKYKTLSLDLEKKYLADKQQLDNLFEIRHLKLLTEKKTVEDFILAKRDKINLHVLPQEELIPFYQSTKGYGYKNAAGKVVIPPQYISANRFEIFNKKYALVQNDIVHCGGPDGLNNYAVIDRKGRQVTPAFIYNHFPTKNQIEISVLKSFKKPRKVYANKSRNNLRNKYLQWEYQTKMQLTVITFDSKFNRISRKTKWINDNGNWFWLEKCFDVTHPDSSD